MITTEGQDLRGVHFGILGTLQVSRSGNAVTPSAAKQKVILALLLLNANKTVSIDGFVEELWGPRPPASASGTIQSLVSRLRRILTESHDGMRPTTPLVRRFKGYQLEVQDEAFDLFQFFRLGQHAERAVAERRYKESARYMESALNLWRGKALIDVPQSPAIEWEAARLEEARATLLENHLEVCLRMKRFNDVIFESRALLRDYPLRERVWGQLMLALYSTGRRGEALATFRTARDHLISELGVDPGRDLQRLHQEILEADHDTSMPNH